MVMKGNRLPAKKESIGKRFDRFVTNIKFVNYLIFVLLISFVVVFAYLLANFMENDRRNQLASSNQKEQDYWYTQSQIISSGTDIVVPEFESETPLFANGKQAVISAFNSLINSTCYELETGGVSYANAVGTNRTITVQGACYKFADGLQFDRNFRKDDASIANQDLAVEMVYFKDKKYQREGRLIVQNGKLSGEFSSEFYVVNSQIKSHPFYVINYDTIKRCTEFSISKSGGKIYSYDVKIELDTTSAVKYYAQEVKEEGGTSIPRFDYINLTCKIDAKGNLIRYDVVEEMNADKSVPVLGNVTAHTKNVMYAKVVSVNKTPNINRPMI